MFASISLWVFSLDIYLMPEVDYFCFNHVMYLVFMLYCLIFLVGDHECWISVAICHLSVLGITFADLGTAILVLIDSS